jgi:hypothetical protein
VRLAQLAYATLPKDVLISIEAESNSRRARARGLGGADASARDDQSAIPPDSNAPPAEILSVIETALRAHFARQIEQ